MAWGVAYMRLGRLVTDETRALSQFYARYSTILHTGWKIANITWLYSTLFTVDAVLQVDLITGHQYAMYLIQFRFKGHTLSVVNSKWVDSFKVQRILPNNVITYFRRYSVASFMTTQFYVNHNWFLLWTEAMRNLFLHVL